MLQTTARFVCPTEICRDFAEQCATRNVDLQVDISFSQVAVEMWASPKDELRPVADLMRELLEERQRHQANLKAISARLREFQAKDLHDHLEPREHYRDFIERRMTELTIAARTNEWPADPHAGSDDFVDVEEIDHDEPE